MYVLPETQRKYARPLGLDFNETCFYSIQAKHENQLQEPASLLSVQILEHIR